MFRKIIVAVDGSDTAELALKTAADLANQYSSSVHLVYAVEHWHLMQQFDTNPNFEPAREEMKKQGQEILKMASETMAKLGCKAMETHLLMGDAGFVITNLAESISADLIVVGSKGHSNLSGMLLGSVSQKIAQHSPCPCMIVR